MARQLAALPKKQFEMYRSKKMLTTDHSALRPGSNQVIKDKLNSDFINKSFISTVEKDLIILQDQVDVLGCLDQPKSGAKPKTEANKKRVSKSKKRKSTNSAANDPAKPPIGSAPNRTGKTGINTVANDKEQPAFDSVVNTSTRGNKGDYVKHNFFSLEDCIPACVGTNSKLTADVSFKEELETRETCESFSSNDSGIVTPKELFFTDEMKEDDSGLGSYTSPVFAKEPPFGFPPSSQRLLESALVLLPSVAIEKDKNSSNLERMSENSKNFSQQSGGFNGEHRHQHNESNKTSLKPREGSISSTHIIEDDPISDFSDAKDTGKDFVIVEGDSIDGDISSSSAIEDEGGWQSQTRSQRRRKKEPVARLNRDRNNTDNYKFQRKDFHKQQSDNQFKKGHYRRRSSENRRNHSKTPDKMLQETESKINNVTVELPAVSVKVDEHLQDTNHKDNALQVVKGLHAPAVGNIASQNKVSSTQKVMSYRDALLKPRPKEPVESSDSGVDATSISSCDLTSSQDSFNRQQCADYLRYAWKKVLSDARQGLVIYFSVDLDPVWCEQKRNNVASGKRSAFLKS